MDLPASAFGAADGRRVEPSNNLHALVAQWIEHLSSEQGVVGSIPAQGTNKNSDLFRVFAFIKRLPPVLKDLIDGIIFNY